MLQYSDLTLRDISYYWNNSILLIKEGKEFLPCKLGDIDDDRKYPIPLMDIRTGRRIINLGRDAFVRRVLIHHPALGYGDYKGMPLYLSVRAGRERRKGVDSNNLAVSCPINWKKVAMTRLAKLSKEANKIINAGKTALPRALSQEYAKLQRLTMNNPSLGRRDITYSDGSLDITSATIRAHIIHQCVNNLYPTLRTAIRTLRSDDTISGVSVSRDFALIQSTTAPKNCVEIFHKMSKVGHINILSMEVFYNSRLSKAARGAVDLAFDRVRR